MTLMRFRALAEAMAITKAAGLDSSKYRVDRSQISPVRCFRPPHAPRPVRVRIHAGGAAVDLIGPQSGEFQDVHAGSSVVVASAEISGREPW
ncbi:hypothetical protein AB0D11_38865 [Streptomyces monashensis]|uniref:hypothetical protein n=1 Tax=Streptomyces monashensis TaxID=1678012 RepID=UPI00340BB225